jgi:hypothetical protein
LAPDHVEATMMAFSASIINMSNGLIGSLTGYYVNKWFVGCSKDELSKYWILVCISIGSCLFEFTFIHLVPTKEEIEKELKDRSDQNAEEELEGSVEMSTTI